MNTPAVCNIGDVGASRRRKGAIFWLVVALAASAWLIVRPAALPGYAALAVAYGLSAIGFLQARERT